MREQRGLSRSMCTTSFEPVALFGLENGENLFLSATGWDATTIPLTVQRQPFMIGVDGDELLVHIDLDNPRCSRIAGEPVFLPHGGTTEFLEQANARLLAIHQGLQATPVFISALVALELLESFVLDVKSATLCRRTDRKATIWQNKPDRHRAG